MVEFLKRGQGISVVEFEQALRKNKQGTLEKGDPGKPVQQGQRLKAGISLVKVALVWIVVGPSKLHIET